MVIMAILSLTIIVDYFLVLTLSKLIAIIPPPDFYRNDDFIDG
jgi:hypothetical protein